MSDREPPAIREARIAAMSQDWAQALTTPITPDQQKIIDLATRFVTGEYGRPGELFDRSVGESQPFELRSDDFRNIPASREHHLFIASYLVHMLSQGGYDPKEVLKLGSLITDLDLVLGDGSLQSPYQDDVEGVFKFYHPDFDALRTLVPQELRNRFYPPRPWVNEH